MSDLGYVSKQATCFLCGKGLSKYISQLDRLIKHDNEDLCYVLSYCDTCNQCYWLVIDTNNKKVVSQQLLYMSNNVSSIWVDIDTTWFICGNCQKIHSKPFKKSKFCPDCGSFMINFVK